jgi:hypothetical protein
MLDTHSYKYAVRMLCRNNTGQDWTGVDLVMK